jgi:hypothetical protein
MSFFMSNVPLSVPEAQRATVERLLPELHRRWQVSFYQVLTQGSHADAIDQFIRDTGFDIYVLLDIDAVPLTAAGLHTVIEAANQGTICGAIQRANHIDNGRLFQPHDDAVRHGRDGCDALRLTGKTSLAEEFIGSEDRDDRFLALLGNDGDLGLAFLDIEHRVSGVPLGEDCLLLLKRHNFPALPEGGEKGIGVKISYFVGRRTETHSICPLLS